MRKAFERFFCQLNIHYFVSASLLLLHKLCSVCGAIYKRVEEESLGVGNSEIQNRAINNVNTVA